jgi:hypothetical protein
MAGKQKGSSSRSLSSDNDPILRDSNISDKLGAIDSKFDSKFDELDSKFAALHNEFSSSNVRMQSCEAQGTSGQCVSFSLIDAGNVLLPA